MNVKQVQNRISEATDVFVGSLKRILKEYERNKRMGTEFGTYKKRPKTKIKTDRDDFDKCVL
jgi:hypothetical protein